MKSKEPYGFKSCARSKTARKPVGGDATGQGSLCPAQNHAAAGAVPVPCIPAGPGMAAPHLQCHTGCLWCRCSHPQVRHTFAGVSSPSCQQQALFCMCSSAGGGRRHGSERSLHCAGWEQTWTRAAGAWKAIVFGNGLNGMSVCASSRCKRPPAVPVIAQQAAARTPQASRLTRTATSRCRCLHCRCSVRR